MKDNQLEKFIEQLRSLRMTSNEKSKMRMYLASLSHASKPSPYYHQLLTSLRRGSAIAMIVILSIGSVTNIVSGEALPGEILYSVKITHEEIKQAVTFGPVKKTNYEIKRTEKRIQEATRLVQKERLDDTRQVRISTSIKEQIEDIQKGIQKIKTTDPEKARELHTILKSTIETNSHLLKEMIEKKTIEKYDEEEIIDEENEIDIQDTSLDKDASVQETFDQSEILHEQSKEETTPSKEALASILLNTITQEMDKIEEKERELAENKETEENDAEMNLDTQENIEELNNDISSLQNIIDIKNDIEKIENGIELTEELSSEVNEIITSFKEKAKKLISDGNYERALEVLKELLIYHTEHSEKILDETNIQEENPTNIETGELSFHTKLGPQTLNIKRKQESNVF